MKEFIWHLASNTFTLTAFPHASKKIEGIQARLQPADLLRELSLDQSLRLDCLWDPCSEMIMCRVLEDSPIYIEMKAKIIIIS